MRYLAFLIVLIAFSSSLHAQKLSQEKFEVLRGECLATEASGSYDTVDHEIATQKCLSACPEDLKIYNNRYAGSCINAHNQFKKMMAQKFDAPIAQVTGTIDYKGYKIFTVISANNTLVSKQCSTIILAAAESYPAPMKGHHMMIYGVKGNPIVTVATKAVLINVRLPSNKESVEHCTAEVINLPCPPHQLDLPHCNP
ncbi:MAG: hypothetical protein AB8B92_11315 [Gammaproteobacteria bacterium]